MKKKRKHAMELAAESIVGDRTNQEDAYAIASWEDRTASPGVAVCIADGMGGHAFGAEAARAAVTGALDAFLTGEQDLEYRLQAAVEAANDAVARAKRQMDTDQTIGCTLVLAAVSAAGVFWISVGDSLIFHVTSDGVHRLNRDHSMASVLDQMADRGEITRDEALQDSRRNVLRSALTGEAPSLIDVNLEGVPVAEGDRLYFATDGILRIEQQRLFGLLESDCHPERAIGAVMDALKTSGHRPLDNTTIVACRYPRRRPRLRRWLLRGSRNSGPESSPEKGMPS